MKEQRGAEAAYEVVLLCTDAGVRAGTTSASKAVPATGRAQARAQAKRGGARTKAASEREPAGAAALAEGAEEMVEPPTAAELADAIDHTRDWPEAARAAARARAAVRLSEPLPSPERLAPFVARVAAAAQARPCVAIWWKPAERLVAPAALAAAVRAGDPLRMALNLRLFHVEKGAAEERVLDCVGLAALGLPDVQCHFVGLDPALAAAVVEDTARYLFDEGDVIEDGDTVPAPDGGQWACRREEALVDPVREVIDVTPPEQFAARP